MVRSQTVVRMLVLAGVVLGASAWLLQPLSADDAMQVTVIEDMSPVWVQGKLMVPARAFFRQTGADLVCTDEGYCVDLAGHHYAIRPGKREYTYDNAPHTFACAPAMRAGELYVPAETFISDCGGRLIFDGSRWYAETPTAFAAPTALRMDSPRVGQALRTSFAVVDGYGPSCRQLQVVMYWYAPDEPAHGRIIYVTPERTQTSGYYQARVPLAGDGQYRVVVRLLDDAGGIEEEQARWFAAKWPIR